MDIYDHRRWCWFRNFRFYITKPIQLLFDYSPITLATNAIQETTVLAKGIRSSGFYLACLSGYLVVTILLIMIVKERSGIDSADFYLFVEAKHAQQSGNSNTVCPPLLLIFFRPLWQNEQANGLGLLALIMMSSSVFMTQSILNDREDGVIVRILTSPITMLHYLSQNLLSAVLPLIVQTTVILAIGKGYIVGLGN